MHRSSLCAAALLIASMAAIGWVESVPAEEPAKPAAPVEMNERETAFAKLLSDSQLRGSFTIEGRTDEDGKPALSSEAYDLGEVRKLPNGKWLLNARIHYGDHDVTLPLALPIEWAGDTPVIIVDNIGFPGLGTYSARVLFHGNHYAGYWQGGNHGGHLFGTIARADAEKKPAKETETE